MSLRARLTAVLTSVMLGLSLAVAGSALTPAQAANRVTPGNFTGYGFDQCLAPNQRAMDAWLRSSPFWAVGIYISGASRACRSQPNLTPTWISTQLRNGWRLLPITLGPQAWCTTRDRYLQQVRINPKPANRYAKARRQGRAEARKTVAAAQRLGISKGSTLWYDLEAFDIRPRDCRESALSFLQAWTKQLRGLGYVSGVYSSAASGIRMLDDARVNRPGRYVMPDQIWIADWNGRADVHSSYIRSTGWMPHARVHQYRGGHNETHGGVTINIDSNWLDLGKGTTARPAVKHCGGVRVDFRDYPRRTMGSEGDLVEAAQCLLRRGGWYDGEVSGVFDKRTRDAVRVFTGAAGLRVGGAMSRPAWTALVVRGSGYPILKRGSGSRAVRRLQRALNATDAAGLATTGVFDRRTTIAVKRYQRDHGMRRTGVVTDGLWTKLRRGAR
jgi:peptidoglycan hydrolase-like protein with peptidoglycan-binding domain